MTTYEQCILRDGTTQRVCLLPAGRVRPGVAVTLKDSENPARRWQVIEVGQPISESFVHRTWENDI